MAKPITCKAAVVWDFKQPITIETVEVSPPGKGEVRVKIISAGLCHGDLGAIDGYFPGKKLPFVLGHEGAGIVESVGEGVTSVKPGDKVLTLFISQCRSCSKCNDSRSNFCYEPGRVNPSGAFGRCLGFDGETKFTCKGKPLYMFTCCSSFSEYTVIPETSCVKINSAAPLDKVSIFACGYPTGYGAVEKLSDVHPGDITAVWGLGGVGLPAVAALKNKKAKQIIGINFSPGKENIGRKYGCTDFISIANLKEDESLEKKIKQMTNDHGLDIAIVCVGNTSAMEAAVSCLAPGGTCVLAGAASQMKVNPVFLLSGRSIKGCAMGGYKIRDEIPTLVDNYLSGQLPADELTTGYFKLDQINEMVDLLKSSKSIRSVVLMDK
ncbi:NAD/NADP dependent alcohol dehydrogenase [Chamberlinius hualienensis]